jgi:hypothetical protein
LILRQPLGVTPEAMTLQFLVDGLRHSRDETMIRGALRWLLLEQR